MIAMLIRILLFYFLIYFVYTALKGIFRAWATYRLIKVRGRGHTATTTTDTYSDTRRHHGHHGDSSEKRTSYSKPNDKSTFEADYRVLSDQD